MTEPEMQPLSLETWGRKYQLFSTDEVAVDKTVDDTFDRVARALSKNEKSPETWHKLFLKAMREGCIPAGRILANAGAQDVKPAGSMANCTVLPSPADTLVDIMRIVAEAATTLKAGCGTGYDFSTLRPKGAKVTGAGSSTSGPISFMEIFDAACRTISSAGGRRGAQMATMDIRHPDIEAFIKAKRQDGMLRQFNLSPLITDAFMEAKEEDGLNWPLVFPIRKKYYSEDKHEEGIQVGNVKWEKWPVPDLDREDYVFSNDGIAGEQVLCLVYKLISAKDLWDTIMRSTFDFAEPGFIMVDEYNRKNNLWFDEDIRATNPCGEQGLPDYGTCLLGSINLVKYVKNPFTKNATFNMAKFKGNVGVFTRMLDNVIEDINLPLPQFTKEISRKRRHGMGYTGLGSALSMMGIRYGSPEAVAFVEMITSTMAVTGFDVGVALAIEKGPAPIMLEEFPAKPSFLPRLDGTPLAGNLKETYTGAELMAYGSDYLRGLLPDNLKADIAKHGCRFSHHSSIAPTGTISLSVCNNVSNGIEPTFSHMYTRNVIKEGRSTKSAEKVFSYELLMYCKVKGLDPEDYGKSEEEGGFELPEYCAVSDSVTPVEHINMQAAAQKYIDSSVSKTINCDTNIPFNQFQGIYQLAYNKGLKGCTTFRFNPENFQGVLVREDDLANTEYVFTTKEGSFTAKGNDTIVYMGEEHSAANLYDALKEGLYGRY